MLPLRYRSIAYLMDVGMDNKGVNTMEQTIIREDIFSALKEYDKKKKTNFASLLSQKVTDAKLAKCGNEAYNAYKRGEVHGLCLALVNLGLITCADAQDILYELAR